MSGILDSFDVDCLRRAINAHPGDTFHTKDISEAAAVRAAHPAQTEHSYYHAHVGKVLKRSMVELASKS